MKTGTCTGGGGACSAAAGVRRAVRFHSVKFYYGHETARARGGRLLARRPSAPCRLALTHRASAEPSPSALDPHPKPGPNQFCAELRTEASTERQQ